ncbi:MAG: hypothetical protein ACQERJ_10385 [Bacillota bacterium]
MTNKSLAKKTQIWIDQLKSYQKKAPALFEEDVKKSDSKFKIEHYFDILDKIKLEKGCLVDYLYIKEKMGGQSIIIAYPELKKSEYKKIITKINNNDIAISNQNSSSENIINTFLYFDDVENYLMHLRLDASEESYLQFVILAELGSQFSLFWHAAYNDKEFICTPEKAEKIIDRIESQDKNINPIENNKFSQQTIKKVKEINFEPEIDISDDKAVVRLVFFSKWGGFIEAKYSIKKTFPHKIIKRETNILVKYNCGYVY